MIKTIQLADWIEPQRVELKGWWEYKVHDQCADEGVNLLAQDIPDRYVYTHGIIPNALVDGGIDLLLRRGLEGNSLAVITTIQLGTSSASFSRTQTGCQTPITTGGLEEATATLSFFARVSTGGFSDRATLTKTFAATADHNVTEMACRSVLPRCLNRIVASAVVLNTQNFTATYNLDINTI